MERERVEARRPPGRYLVGQGELLTSWMRMEMQRVVADDGLAT